MEVLRRSVEESSEGTYGSAFKTVLTYFEWWRNLFHQPEDVRPAYEDKEIAMFITWCLKCKRNKKGVRCAFKTIVGYVSAWKYHARLGGETVLVISNMDFAKKALAAYRRIVRRKPDKRTPVGMVNGKLQRLWHYFQDTSVVQAHMVRNPSRSRAKTRWLLRVHQVAILLIQKAVLRPEEVAVSCAKKQYRCAKWCNVQFIWDESEQVHDLIYNRPYSKTNVLGEEIQRVPVKCECPYLCLPCELLKFRREVRNCPWLGERYIAPDSFILWTGKRTILTMNQVYDEWALACAELEWNHDIHKVYSLRSGRCQDLYCAGLTPEDIKRLGCWRSNGMITYMRETAEDQLYMLRLRRKRATLKDLAKQYGIAIHPELPGELKKIDLSRV